MASDAVAYAQVGKGPEAGSNDAEKPKYRELLPSCLINDEVARLADTEFADKPSVPMGLSVGPGIPLLRVTLITIIAYMSAMTVLTGYESQCTDTSYAVYPIWLWLPFLPLIFFRCYTEWRCLSYAAIPYIQVVGSFKILGKDASVQCWLAWASFLTLLNCMDICTDSFFVGSTFRTASCPGEMITEIWHYTMSESKVVFWLASVPFAHVCLTFFALAFLQVLWPIISTTPSCEESRVDYKIGGKDPDSGEKYILEFANIYGAKTNMGNALYALAEGCGMSTLQTHNPWYPRQKVQQILDNQKDQEQRLMGAYSVLRGELERGLVKYGLNALLENALQANLQISIFAMSRASLGQHKHMQWQQLFSIAIGIILGLVRASLVFELVRFYRQVTDEKTKASDQTYQELASDDEAGKEPSFRMRHRGSLLTWGSDKEEILCRRLMIIVLVMWSMFIGLMSYAVAKLIMCFICDDSVWNVTGCVDLSHLNL